MGGAFESLVMRDLRAYADANNAEVRYYAESEFDVDASALVSVNEPVAQPTAGQRQRHLCHTNRTGRPKSASPPAAPQRRPWTTPSAPQPQHTGRCRVRVCTCTTNGPAGSSSTPTTSASPNPTNNSQTRVRSCSTEGFQIRCRSTPILEALTHLSADPVPVIIRRAPFWSASTPSIYAGAVVDRDIRASLWPRGSIVNPTPTHEAHPITRATSLYLHYNQATIWSALLVFNISDPAGLG